MWAEKNRLECHEIWDYDEDLYVQILKGLIVLCPRCHQVKHFGRSEIVGIRAQALVQLMGVNGWDNRQAEDHVTEAKIQWAERSRHKWKLDISWLTTGMGVSLK